MRTAGCPSSRCKHSSFLLHPELASVDLLCPTWMPTACAGACRTRASRLVWEGADPSQRTWCCRPPCVCRRVPHKGKLLAGTAVFGSSFLATMRWLFGVWLPSAHQVGLWVAGRSPGTGLCPGRGCSVATQPLVSMLRLVGHAPVAVALTLRKSGVLGTRPTTSHPPAAGAAPPPDPVLPGPERADGAGAHLLLQQHREPQGEIIFRYCLELRWAW